MPELTGQEPDLQVGDSGEGVMLLQVRLYGLGIYRQVPDGTFNMTTENAVRELQSTLGHDNDGMVTRQTWEAVLYLEQQYGIQYQYMSPYDALSQIYYDREHPSTASGQYATEYGTYSEDGQWQWDGYNWQAAQGQAGQSGGGANAYAGQMSEDGQWQWDGYNWQAASAGQQGGGGYDQGSYQGSYASAGGQHGQHVSEDGQWRWDGYNWQPNEQHGGGQSTVGQLSPDGQWRWDGHQWQAA